MEIRRRSSRFAERAPGRLTQHSLSFGDHYDPDRLRIGPMVCHDDHLLAEGQGFASHRHSGLEIVTWVLSGAVEHTGPDGRQLVEAGSVAVLSTGDGVEHAEVAARPQTRFVQVWLTADTAQPPARPSYVVTPVDLPPGELVPVARPRPGAAFAVARLGARQSLTVPAADLAHVYVATGALGRFSLAEPLAAGDAFVSTEDGPHQVTATVPTELLVWTFAAESAGADE